MGDPERVPRPPHPPLRSLRAALLRAFRTARVSKRTLARRFRSPERRAIDAPTMPQKPQARAKDKKRLTKRLANWRKKQELAAKPPEPAKTATKG